MSFLSIEVRTEGHEPVPFAIRMAMIRWANEALPVLVEGLRRNAPIDHRSATHMLRDTIYGVRDTTDGAAKVQLRFHSRAPYTKYVIYGTRPHEIWPNRAKALRWLGDNGRPVFAAHVHHPGTRPNDFPRRTWDELRGVLLSRLREEIHREL